MTSAMSPDDLVAMLAPVAGNSLARDLVGYFLQIRQDLGTRTLERSSSGKFVETVVQILQKLSGRTPDPNGKVDVEGFLRECESGTANPPGDLRIPGARACRAMYALRSRRSILHKGEVDPNVYDLRFSYQAAQWLLTEILRSCVGANVVAAGRMVEFVQQPIGELVEQLGAQRLVLSTRVTPREELLLLLRTCYPDPAPVSCLLRDMHLRDPSTVRRALRALAEDRLAHSDPGSGWKLTATGYAEADKVAANILAENTQAPSTRRPLTKRRAGQRASRRRA